MRIAENVEMLELKNKQGAVYPVLAWDDRDAVLFDTGLPGEIGLLQEAVAKAGFELRQITKVFLTHQDLDHIGSARQLSDMGAKIYAHEAEAPYIQGEVTSVRLQQMEERLEQMDEGERAYYEQVKLNAPRFFVNVDYKLKDGEVLDICGGIKAVHTPGHMPGHVALLLLKSGIMITGDAANIAEGKLIGANPVYTVDIPLAEESFNKMLAENPAKLATYHGGIIEN